MSYKAQLDASLKERGIGKPSLGFQAPSFDSFKVDSFPWTKVAFYILLITLIVILVLVVIHFTIRPVFRFKSGSKGFITIPGIAGADDGKIYWPTIDHGELMESNSILAGSQATVSNYSMAIDLMFVNLNVGTNDNNIKRPVFLRYNSAISSITDPEYAIGIFLDPLVNDLYVRLRTVANNTEEVVIKNVVAKKPMRIGVIVQPTYFEVYRDGLLVRTQTLIHPPKGDVGTFWCNPGRDGTTQGNTCGGGDFEGTLGYGINLHLWRRALKSQEMQYSMPAMPTVDTYRMPTTTQGISGYLNTVSSTLNQSLQTLTPDSLDSVVTNIQNTVSNVGNTATQIASGATNQISTTLQNVRTTTSGN